MGVVYWPKSVVTTYFFCASGVVGIWWNPEHKSVVLKYLDSASSLTQSLISGRG